MTENTHKTHNFLLQTKHNSLPPLSLTHKRTKISAKKANIKGNILLSLLAAVGRGAEKIQNLSHNNNVTSSPLKRGADVRFVKLQSCNCISIKIG